MRNFSQQLKNLSPQQRALFEAKLKQKGIKLSKVTQIPKRQDNRAIPLSFAQQRLWFIQQLEPDNSSYNVPCTLKLEGKLDTASICQTLNEIVKRHEILRTTFEIDDNKNPIQVVQPYQEFELPTVELSRKEISSVETIIREAAKKPFDLAQPLLKIKLFKLAENSHILLIVTHHIISDRWSIGVFFKEIAILYHAFLQQQKSPLLELPIQYADWAVWQRNQLTDGELEGQVSYWKKQLKDISVLELPSDRTRLPVPSYSGSKYPLVLDKTLSNKLKALSHRTGVTLFTLLLTAFKVLLYRYSSQEDIVVGTDIAGRDRIETEGLIGLLVNTLVLRSNLSNNPTFIQLLEQVKQVVLKAFSHQDLPFEKLVEVLNPERDLSQMMPLFQVKFDFQLAEVKPLQLTDLKVERLAKDEETVKYELRFNLQDSETGINGQVEYSTDLFDRSTIARMVEHFQVLLEGIVNNPQQQIARLPLINAKEKEQIEAINNNVREYPQNKSIVELFSAQAQKTPQAIALVHQDQQLTYAQLNQKSDQLAEYLQELGVKLETRVGICLERSSDMIVGMLAILKAGGAYVPLDPNYPKARLDYIVEDSQIGVLLTQTKYTQNFVDRNLTVVNLDIDIDSRRNVLRLYDACPSSDKLAYIIYTSGSTGKPKGVAIAHRSTLQLLHWAKEVFTPTELSGVLASTSICFDLSVFEIFVPLSWGGRVILAENALELPNLANKNEVRLVNTVPSAIAALLRIDGIPDSVITVNLAGESLKTELVEGLYSKSHIKSVYNLYGPSEDTTYSTYARLENTDRVSATIGKPVANTQAYILDQYLQPVPIGVPGELYLGGSGLARGYWNRPKITAEKFIPNPFNPVGARHALPLRGERLYKTGDFARYLPNGEIEFLGRIDRQIKIRGYRLEIEEVEATINSHPAVRESVVIAQQQDSLSQSLIAYIIPETNVETLHATSPQKHATSPQKHATSLLQQFLTTKLPSYAIPNVFIQLDELPLLPNGKIDRKSLPQPDHIHQKSTASYSAPQTETEKTIASIWEKELNLDRIGIDHNFFQLGGHSLLGIKIVACMSEALQREVTLKSLFQYPTIRELAAQLEKSTVASRVALPEVIPDAEKRYEPFPLTDIQQAYLMGRSQGFTLGNIATHAYREIESTISIEAVEAAWNKLIQRHEMLRMVVRNDANQEILPDVPKYKIRVTDLSNNPHCQQELQAIRDRLSHQIISPDSFPLFEIEAVKLSNRVRYCISFDVLMGDAWSFRLLAQEMAQLLLYPDTDLPKLDLSFRDYVLAEQKLQESELYQRAWQYWQQRIPTLPPSPELPLVKNLESITQPRFTRRSYTLSPQLWQNLQQQAVEEKITPSGLLLAAFSEILTAWSKSPQFTINLTLFNRLPLHPDVDRIVGDFTSSTLLEVDNRGQTSFIDRAIAIQSQLWQDLDHRYVSGIKILRELARTKQPPQSVLMPVVFTSTLTQHHNSRDSRPLQAETVYSISQTSQVYLDHQVGEVEGALVFNWDAIDELFPEGVLDDMFAAYCNFIKQLATVGARHCLAPTRQRLAASRNLLPPHQQKLFAQVNATELELQANNLKLQDLFFAQVRKNPQQTAVIAHDYTLTYRELGDRALNLAHTLQPYLTDFEPKIVVTVLEKGWQQVAATLGILTAGAAYVPIDPNWGRDRCLSILAACGAQIVTTAQLANRIEWLNGFDCILIERNPVVETLHATSLRQQTDQNLAYIIYTSGSTGKPKGVAISHQAAINTILDINRRFGIDEGDRVLALSSLSFDLSVYDIFGTLAAGGTIVIPDADSSKDAAAWAELIQQHQITVWNSVPALMEMLVDSSQTHNSTLRLIMLSGDWISLDLGSRLLKTYPNAQIISLGGATEASIWSIFYPIEAIDPNWNSIPYGRPLANQYFKILNDNLEPCPLWVTGQLYIGGAGLALGYWQDRPKTDASFIIHPQTQERLYKTGDLGRYLPDGNIEFLGREDFQVKVNGYRIELGEIETNLQQHPQIDKVLVAAVGDVSHKQLVAYIVPKTVNKIELKLQQRGIRKIGVDETEIALANPETDDTAAYLSRQSYRQFLQQETSINSFSQFLSCLRQVKLDNSPLPKYRYGSAGSLYPVQTYLYVKPNCITELKAGFYYYHPQKHSLVAVSIGDIQASVYGVNQAIFEQASFSIFLIGELEAIYPIYHDSARDFCLLEAGYMGQLLMETAPKYNLGICPIGKLETDWLQDSLKLQPSQILLHSFVGGSIAPEWTKQWRQNSNSNPTESIKDSLRQYLKQKLPDYMIPTSYIILNEFPLTSNGKIDRRSLPTPDQNHQNLTEYVAPRNQIETQIVNIWQENLKQEKIGVYDNFFDLGGNSLSATQVINTIKNTFSIQLSIRQFFSEPTVANISEIVESHIQNLNDSVEATKIEKVERETTAELPDLDNLSEAEMDSLLQQMLDE